MLAKKFVSVKQVYTRPHFPTCVNNLTAVGSRTEILITKIIAQRDLILQLASKSELFIATFAAVVATAALP